MMRRGADPTASLAASRGRSASPIVRFRSPRADTEARPKAVLTTLTLLGVIYTASISGGYGLEDSVSAGGPLLSILFLCLIPFVWGIPVSLCVAELSCSIPSNAGPIMWVNCSFPPWVTFTTVLWTAFLNSVDNSLYPAVFADYCATLFHLGWVEKSLLKIFFLWMCALINIVGVMLVGTFSVAVMIVTILPFFLMFVLQLPHGFNWERISYVPEKINWAVFLPVVAWNFSGFDSAGNVIEEVQNPNPTFVRALILMIVAALATYIPPILAGASAQKLDHVPFDKWGDGFWVKVGEAVGGTPMAATVMVGGAISTLGLMTTLLATTSRSIAGMGTLNAFPSFFSKWVEHYSEKYKTPVHAILVNTTITCILSVCLTFQTLVQLDQVLYALRLIAILTSFLKLRLTQPLLERPYRVPGGNVAAVIWSCVPIVFSTFLIAMAMTGGPFIFYSSVVLILGTVIVSYVTVRFFRPDGFEGSLVEEYEDADMQTYGTILQMESSDWRNLHQKHLFIDQPPHINMARLRA
ncbi:putative amino acid permease [Leptomonas pyrrhocoris]|uniref:Putative amino acid permease n=1 Tax=Leptomonas pyrrhocoris TaxID=157538 RepID=A0A0M9GAV2_LEPPY|nr:putative amino acid permease [Leptomonas pyrrhocoris]KPA86540.1 putative amino acid permease [Leptomonas pyrrhocoris]|eukprot:XP_015664979.1 putative amino acid permease [Leptomonas pyrrhocoris]